MGQRAAILLKRKFADGTTEVSMFHNQWAIGKILPAYFMQEVLKTFYPLDRRKEYDNYGKSIKETGQMSFADFGSSLDSHYIIKGKGAETFVDEGKEDRDYNAVDVWDKETILDLFGRTDNNNGGIIVEVIEKVDEEGTINISNIRVGFLLGYDECYCFNKKNDFEKQEAPFERIMSAREYMQRSGGGQYCPKCSIVMFEKFLKTFGIEDVGAELQKAKEAA